jgi:hypothetical protein
LNEHAHAIIDTNIAHVKLSIHKILQILYAPSRTETCTLQFSTFIHRILLQFINSSCHFPIKMKELKADRARPMKPIITIMIMYAQQTSENMNQEENNFQFPILIFH